MTVLLDSEHMEAHVLSFSCPTAKAQPHNTLTRAQIQHTQAHTHKHTLHAHTLTKHNTHTYTHTHTHTHTQKANTHAYTMGLFFMKDKQLLGATTKTRTTRKLSQCREPRAQRDSRGNQPEPSRRLAARTRRGVWERVSVFGRGGRRLEC